jgi:hypothetical protein
MTHCTSKIVVFDLDETLGYFMELGMFWDALNAYIKYKKINQLINQNLFDRILDLYPEFLRPNILVILNYLKKKKKEKHCNKLIIYTNNQGPIEWANYIIKYFEKKINYKMFDQIIAAYKVQGKRVEICRTTHMKSHSDLIKCTKIPEGTQICFIDDVYHPKMANDNINYINVNPYIYDLDFNDMIDRFLNSNILINDNNNNNDNAITRTFMLNFMKKYKYIYVKKTNDSQNIDKIISKKILYYLDQFFKKKNTNIQTNKTKKHNNNNKKNKTFKKIIH